MSKTTKKMAMSKYQKQCPIDGGTCGQGGTCPICENEALGSELIAAKARIAELEKALKSVMPYVITDTVECRGDKCREPWCMSCGPEDDANAAVADALAALRRAAELLEGE